MTDREIMQQALDALEKIAAYRPLTFAECSDAEAVMGIAEKAIPALRDRLAQPVQEPIITKDGEGMLLHGGWHSLPDGAKLYTTPPPCPTCEALARTVMLDQTSHDTHHKPLSDEQIEREWQFLHDEEGNPPDQHDFARAIEAAHGIKGKA